MAVASPSTPKAGKTSLHTWAHVSGFEGVTVSIGNRDCWPYGITQVLPPHNQKGSNMNHRHLLSIATIAFSALATTGCVATGSDGYYSDSGYGSYGGGYGYGYQQPSQTIYVQDRYNDDRYYRDRERDRDRAAREREARERERDRDRDRQARERDRDQRARDEDRRRALERQAQDRERQNRERDRNRFGESRHQQECAAAARQNAAGSDNVLTPSRPCR